MIVLDASITLAWGFADEVTEGVDAVFGRVGVHGAAVPSIWRLEIANSLRTALRRGRIDMRQRTGVFAILGDLQIDTDPETSERSWRETLALSDRYGLTIYDATYLELALRLDLPLATLDRDLAQAASAAGIEVLP